MEFSIAELPPRAREWKQIAIVEAGENNLWQAGKTISLGGGAELHCIAGATEGYLLLARYGESLPASMADYQPFTLDIRTLQLERMCELKRWHIHELLYTNFPPSFLSLPTV
jgi:hypothetical protein